MNYGERECPCGVTFVQRRRDQTYHNTACGRKHRKHSTRAADRTAHSLQFVGVDGEGVDRPDGAHDYVMLSVGKKTLVNSDGSKLDLHQILSFLWNCFIDTPSACYVGFFLGYDFIQWTRLLPERAAYLLFHTDGIAERKSANKSERNRVPDPVVWNSWEIDIMAGRRFKLRPHVCKPSRFDDACRNRTCNERVGFLGDEPLSIQPGEMEWTIDETLPALPFTSWAEACPSAIRERSTSWLYICDTGHFWQTSFLNVIKPDAWSGNPVVSEREYDLIRQGKDGRSRVVEYGEIDHLEEMARYNVLENDILSRVTERLNEGFMNDQITIRLKKNEWYGPGRAAQTWMEMLHARIADKESVAFNKGAQLTSAVGNVHRKNEKGILNADVYQSVPTWFADAARDSYYGGWFETPVIGHVGDVWEYDINSAYPFIIATLPCLHTTDGHNGEYSRGSGMDYPQGSERYTLLHATISGSDQYLGAMPYRTKTGNILRPHSVKGWYWAHEVEASSRAGLISEVAVEQWVSYKACTCPPPFDPADIGITRMYNLRLEVGKNTPAGKAFKLVYNSAYGKTAQSIGTPKFANPIYASLITAGCRTLILDAIASHPDKSSAVSMVATDGVYFFRPHPSLNIDGSQLGAWDETPKTGMTQFMPGVYWDDKTRELIGVGKAPSLKSRGVSARALAPQIAAIDTQFREYSPGDAFPGITFPLGFNMVSSKLAVRRNNWQSAGYVDHAATRTISCDPSTKRIPDAYVDGNLIRTPVYDIGSTGLDTTPYKRQFGFDPELDGVDRDGRALLTFWQETLASA